MVTSGDHGATTVSGSHLEVYKPTKGGLRASQGGLRAQGMWLNRLSGGLLVSPCGSVLGGCIVHPEVGYRPDIPPLPP